MIAGLVLAIFIALTVNSNAQTLPVQGQDALREYALAHVDHGTRYVSSTSMDWGYTDSLTYTNISGKNAEDVLGKLFAVEFRYRMLNPEDQITGYIWLYDKDNNLLFFGSAQYTEESMKITKPQYGIWMQNIPLLSGVQSAEVLAVDADGKTANRTSIQVNDNGQLMFQSWMAGSPNGILVVRMKDGSLLTYDLSNPNAETPGVTTDVAAYKIDGHYIYTDQQKGGMFAVKIIELWTLPTAYITLSTSQQVDIDVMGVVQNGVTSFERPYAMIVTTESGIINTIQLNQGQVNKITFPAGEFRVKFSFTNFGKPNMLYTGPTDGGKG